jgi:hypothetical protein
MAGDLFVVVNSKGECWDGEGWVIGWGGRSTSVGLTQPTRCARRPPAKRSDSQA